MLILLSPAKSLDFETPSGTSAFSQPVLLEQSRKLMARLRKLSPAEIGTLMGISDRLAVLNAERFAAWKPPFSPSNAKQAMLAFNGDVYDGLAARSFGEGDLEYAQSHLRILSGLYGVLRPLDLIQAYRLEMSIKLPTPGHKDLYEFWGERLTKTLNEAARDISAEAVVNLASEEYFRAVRADKLAVPPIQPVFEDWSGGKYKVLGLFAKRARGKMARFAITRRLEEALGLREFSEDGYAFVAEASDDLRWVFRRRSK